MCKKLVLALTATVLSLALCGCASVPEPKEGASAPLKTEGTIAPPKGCVDLRNRGGAC